MELEIIPDDRKEDLMSFKDFQSACNQGMFIDYDGMGSWATSTMYDTSSDWVQPSTVVAGGKPPKWATHVLWHNR